MSGGWVVENISHAAETLAEVDARDLLDRLHEYSHGGMPRSGGAGGSGVSDPTFAAMVAPDRAADGLRELEQLARRVAADADRIHQLWRFWCTVDRRAALRQSGGDPGCFQCGSLPAHVFTRGAHPDLAGRLCCGVCRDINRPLTQAEINTRNRGGRIRRA